MTGPRIQKLSWPLGAAIAICLAHVLLSDSTRQASKADKDEATKDQSQCPDPGSVGIHLVAQSGSYEGQPSLYLVIFGVTERA